VHVQGHAWCIYSIEHARTEHKPTREAADRYDTKAVSTPRGCAVIAKAKGLLPPGTGRALTDRDGSGLGEVRSALGTGRCRVRRFTVMNTFTHVPHAGFAWLAEEEGRDAETRKRFDRSFLRLTASNGSPEISFTPCSA
jgi:hypothetical protein